MLKIILAMLISCLSNNLYAFSWDKCKQNFKAKKKYTFKLKDGPFGTTRITTNESSSNSSSSTTSFFSSTGKCALIGLKQTDRPKLFLVENFEQIKIDSALATGEHLNAFSSLIGCNSIGKQYLSHALRDNYSSIYRTNKIKTAYKNITNLINQSSRLSNNCKVL